MFGFFARSPQPTSTGGLEHRKDLVSISIRKLPEEEDGEEEILATGRGSYLESLKYDGDEDDFWSINDALPRIEWVDVDEHLMLPSDSSQRPDAHHI